MISNKIIYIKIGFYLDICNNSMKYKYLDYLSEDEFVKCNHIEEKIKNPNYFKMDERFLIILLIITKNLIYVLLSLNL